MHHRLVPTETLTSPRRRLIVLAAAVTLAIALLVVPSRAGAIDTGACRNLAVGAPEEVVSDAERDAAGLPGWPDGPLGILPQGDGTYDFYGMDAFGGSPRPQRLTVSRGTLEHPLAGGILARSEVAGIPSVYQWAGGAPVYRDPATGMVLQVLHMERNYSGGGFWSTLGLARLDPATGRSTYLGTVVSPELTYEKGNAHNWNADLGLPSLTIVYHGSEPWFHLYFADFRESKPGVFAADALSVAGAPVQTVLDAAARGQITPWFKRYKGVWTEPGQGGRSDDLEPGQTQAWAPRVVHSGGLGTYVMAAANGGHEVVLSTSADGLTEWSPRVQLFTDPGYYDAYVNLVGAGADPSDLGNDFYLYYTQWLSKDPNWEKARLLRRVIHCDAPPAPPVQPAQPAPAAPPVAPPAQPASPPQKSAPAKPQIDGVKVREATLTWRRHRLGLAVRGQVLPPKGVTGCRGGKVSIGLWLGKAKDPALQLSSRVGKDCRFGASQTLTLRHQPRKATLALQFLGNAGLSRGDVVREQLRVRRAA